MARSDKVMEWIVGRPLPSSYRRSRSPHRQRKVVVHVETSESEYCSDTSSDVSSFTTTKKVRFRDDTKEGFDSKGGSKAEEKKKSALKKNNGQSNSGQSSSDASSGEECESCKGHDKVNSNNSKSEGKQSKQKGNQNQHNRKQQGQTNSDQSRPATNNTNQDQFNFQQNQIQSFLQQYYRQQNQNQNWFNGNSQNRKFSPSNPHQNPTRNMVHRILQPSR